MSREGREGREGRGGRGFRSVLKRVAGMPDYEAYLRHMREAHPGRPVLSEREFFEEFVASKYGDGPTRCC